MLTASDEERDLVESYRLGVNSYVLKPVDFLSDFRRINIEELPNGHYRRRTDPSR